VTPVDLASAFATIAAGGVYHQPHLVTKVTTSDDRVLYEAVSPDQRRFSEQVARNVTEGMLGVPTYDKLGLPSGQAVAAKTGTVQSRFEGQNNDAWIAGFTPKVATVVWIGTDQNSPIKNSKGAPIYGNMLPGSIWKSFMSDATRERSGGSFGPFKAIGTPPAVTGQYDGFAAQSAQPAPPPSSTFPSEPLSPDGLPSTATPDTTGGTDDQDRRRSSGSGDAGGSSTEQPEPQTDRDTTTRDGGDR
ncbi:MAG: penicillin-binding protein, partial [Pseudonocardia sp.]|nr:penicillin-binding protein [Pseudonocardia sp.]